MKYLTSMGVLICIIGAAIAAIGGFSCVGVESFHEAAIGGLVAFVGGLIAAIGGNLVAIGRKPE